MPTLKIDCALMESQLHLRFRSRIKYNSYGILFPNQIHFYLTKSKLSNLTVMCDSGVVLIWQLQAINQFLPDHCGSGKSCN